MFDSIYILRQKLIKYFANMKKNILPICQYAIKHYCIVFYKLVAFLMQNPTSNEIMFSYSSPSLKWKVMGRSLLETCHMTVFQKKNVNNSSVLSRFIKIVFFKAKQIKIHFFLHLLKKIQ